MNRLLVRRLNLLIIDDDPSIVRLLSRVVQRHFGGETQLHSLTDPTEAKHWLDRNCCDLLVSDIDMPTINGLELLRFAKHRNAWTQVVFITGHSTRDRISIAIEQGASDYLLKPIDRDEVVTVLGQLIQRAARWQSAVLNTLQVTT